MLFEKAHWIWTKAEAREDEYADFLFDFEGGAEDLILRLSADSNYAAWLNGEWLGFGQYADYPDWRVYDELGIPAARLRRGTNRLSVQVWYYGVDSQTYRRGEAGLILELCDSQHTLLASGLDTLSRPAPDYIAHIAESISVQLGLNYHYDSMRADNWRRAEDGVPTGFAPSRAVHSVRPATKRPVEKLRLGPRCPSALIAQGVFRYSDPSARSADRMQNAFLGWRDITALSDGQHRDARPLRLHRADSDGEGLYLILDLGQEESGFLELDFEVDEDCDVEIGYGEHLQDGRCRTAVRCFALDYRAHRGHNRWMNPFRRLGGRYLQCFFHANALTLHYIGLRPTDYPLQARPFDAGNALRQSIYDTCLRTLRLCMHEHYEDCPWREQALYTMDSRNQMLCGYYAFGETRFPRACLELMTHGFREDGLMNLCFPAGRDFPIPYFSLMYFVQMREYIEYSGDDTLAVEHFALLERLMALFLNRRDETGLCPNFISPEHWNFYEWQPTLEGYEEGHTPSHDAPLNGFLSLALENLATICRALGKGEEAARYRAERAALNKALLLLYRPEAGLFESYDTKFKGRYSVLTNSLMLLCGAADGLNTARIEAALATNGANGGLIPNTLSMNAFRYDALLKLNKQKYLPLILSEIDGDYLYMLRRGATSFWETIKGEADFNDAGSLCHGWSALPVYYYWLASTQT